MHLAQGPVLPNHTLIVTGNLQGGPGRRIDANRESFIATRAEEPRPAPRVSQLDGFGSRPHFYLLDWALDVDCITLHSLRCTFCRVSAIDRHSEKREVWLSGFFDAHSLLLFSFFYFVHRREFGVCSLLLPSPRRSRIYAGPCIGCTRAWRRGEAEFMVIATRQ